MPTYWCPRCGKLTPTTGSPGALDECCKECGWAWNPPPPETPMEDAPFDPIEHMKQRFREIQAERDEFRRLYEEADSRAAKLEFKLRELQDQHPTDLDRAAQDILACKTYDMVRERAKLVPPGLHLEAYPGERRDHCILLRAALHKDGCTMYPVYGFYVNTETPQPTDLDRATKNILDYSSFADLLTRSRLTTTYLRMGDFNGTLLDQCALLRKTLYEHGCTLEPEYGFYGNEPLNITKQGAFGNEPKDDQWKEGPK